MAQLFYELQLPEQNDEDGKMIWVVRIKEQPAYYLLNDGSFLLDNLQMCRDDVFHFDTLQDAHHHACEYYTSHKEVYPYFTEYQHAMVNLKLPNDIDDVDDNDIHSQVMTF